jgi:hypothetical protein
MILRAALPILVCTTLLWNGEVAADRMPLPEISICNKTKKTIYLAKATDDTYTGWHLDGWTLIKPKRCADFRNDAFHFRGKHKVLGLSTRTLPGCVTDEKAFSLIMGSWNPAKSPAKCKAKKGRVVQFRYPKAGPKVRLDVVK